MIQNFNRRFACYSDVKIIKNLVMKSHHTTPIHLHIIILCVIWSLLFVMMVGWKLSQNTKITHELAER